MENIARFLIVSAALLSADLLRAAEPSIGAPHFMGSQSCKSSGCHGGGAGKDQVLLWEKKDKHTRTIDDLANNRAKRMAESMGIGDPTKSARCTICHSPMQALPDGRLAEGVVRETGVSCETCHGPAEKWRLFHTRPDVSHDQRVAAGLREAGDFYHRANVCIACHHIADAGLLAAGHPEMFFDLDGQMAKEPPHWKDEGTWLGPRAWLTGQAAALREISWKLTTGSDPDLIARWKALVWLLRKTDAGSSLPNTDDFAAMQTAADRLARTASRQDWSKESTLRLLKIYTGLAEEFRDGTAEAADLRRRGEVLVYPIDRLWTALKTNAQFSSDNLDKSLEVLGIESKRQKGFDAPAYAGVLKSVEAAFELLPKK